MKETKESVEFVKDFFLKKNVDFVFNSDELFIIVINNQKFFYNYFNGNWWCKVFRRIKKPKTYSSRGVEEFYEKYLLPNINELNRINSITDYKNFFSDKISELLDLECKKPFAFGYKMKDKCSLEIFEKIKKENDTEFYDGAIYIIHKRLSRIEAIELYGDITNEEIGPKGGWKSITFGNTKFTHKQFKNNEQF